MQCCWFPWCWWRPVPYRSVNVKKTVTVVVPTPVAPPPPAITTARDLLVDARRDKPVVAILFIAPDGIYQPTCWERWRDNDEKLASRILFYVQTSNFTRRNSIHGASFVSAFATDEKDAGFANMDAITYVYRDCESKRLPLSRLYIASGHDIPAKSTEWFLKQAAENTNSALSSRVRKITLSAHPNDSRVPTVIYTHSPWIELTFQALTYMTSIESLSIVSRLESMSDLWTRNVHPEECVPGIILTYWNLPVTRKTPAFESKSPWKHLDQQDAIDPTQTLATLLRDALRDSQTALCRPMSDESELRIKGECPWYRTCELFTFFKNHPTVITE